jgi:sugar phosphate permease
MPVMTNLTIRAPQNPGDMPPAAPAGEAAPSSYRWLALFVVWLAFLLSYVDRVAWSSVAAPVGESLGLAVSMLGTFVTAFYIGYVVANVAGGIMTDFLGGRLMLALALIPLGVFTFCFGYVRSLEAGIVIQAAMGFAAGADYAAGMKLIATWFGRDRGRAMGIYTTATSLALVIANATVPSLSEWYGWSSAFQLLGLVTFVWGLAALLLLRDSPQGVSPPKSTSMRDVLPLFRNRTLICLSIAGCGGLWATVGFGAWGNALMTKQYGIPPVVAGSIIAWFGIGAVLAKPTLGWISDLLRGSRKLISILCLLAFAAMLFVFGQCSTTAQFYLVAPVLGAAAFGYTPVLMAQISDATGRESAGAAAGLTNAIWQSGSALSPLLVGKVYEATHSVLLAALTLSAGPLLGVAALLFVVSARPK